MKIMKKFTAVVLALVLALSCFCFSAYAAPTITKVKIIQLPKQTDFYQGVDWDYGYYSFPDDGDGTGVFVKRDGIITFLHNGGLYSNYSDRGMIDMTGLIVEVTYSDGTKKNVEYKETISKPYARQNIYASPKNGYNLGENIIEVYFKENVNAYDSYKINILVSKPDEKLMGDVNFDGVLNSTDALMVLQHIVETMTFNANQLAVADMNSDGKINSADALAILKAAVDNK